MRKRILTEDDLKRNLSEFTEDSTHRTVTDAEKKAWNSKLANIVNVDSSKSKTKGNSSAGKWTEVGTVRNLEDWVGDFDKRTRENRDNIKANKNTIEEVRKSIRGIAAEYTYPEIIFSNTTNLGEVLNQSFGTSFNRNTIRSVSNLAHSDTAMKELCNNEGAINLALKSEKFLESVIYYPSIMDIIANSEKAMKIAAKSRFVIRKFFSKTTPRKAIAKSDIAVVSLLDAPYINSIVERSYQSDNSNSPIKRGYPLVCGARNVSFKLSPYEDTVYIRNNERKIVHNGSTYYIVFNENMAQSESVYQFTVSDYDNYYTTLVFDLDKLER